MTHFSDADGPKRHRRGAAGLRRRHARPARRAYSLSNSAATLRHGDALAGRSDWVRPGILVYGSAPDFPGARRPAGTCSRR